MSDEERMAIEHLKNESAIKIVLNLIEKQSKEIEELKELKWYYEISRVPKDKIRAKIEELSNGTYDAKIVLQSLLEKE